MFLLLGALGLLCVWAGHPTFALVLFVTAVVALWREAQARV